MKQTYYVNKDDIIISVIQWFGVGDYKGICEYELIDEGGNEIDENKKCKICNKEFKYHGTAKFPDYYGNCPCDVCPGDYICKTKNNNLFVVQKEDFIKNFININIENEVKELKELLLDCWYQWSYCGIKDNKKCRSSGGLSTLEDIESILCTCGKHVHYDECILGKNLYE